MSKTKPKALKEVFRGNGCAYDLDCGDGMVVWYCGVVRWYHQCLKRSKFIKFLHIKYKIFVHQLCLNKNCLKNRVNFTWKSKRKGAVTLDRLCHTQFPNIIQPCTNIGCLIQKGSSPWHWVIWMGFQIELWHGLFSSGWTQHYWVSYFISISCSYPSSFSPSCSLPFPKCPNTPVAFLLHWW